MVNSIETYFITPRKPITQFVEGSPCSNRPIVLAIFVHNQVEQEFRKRSLFNAKRTYFEP
jgi:hypothetical protein